MLAMLFPDTTGLSQIYETEMYWVQHAIIQIISVYLLCRKGFIGARLASVRTVLVGLWLLAVMHWIFYEV